MPEKPCGHSPVATLSMCTFTCASRGGVQTGCLCQEGGDPIPLHHQAHCGPPHGPWPPVHAPSPSGLAGLCPGCKADHKSLTQPGTSHGGGDQVSCLGTQRVGARRWGLPLCALGPSLLLLGPQPSCLGMDTAEVISASKISPSVIDRFPGVPTPHRAPTIHTGTHSQAGPGQLEAVFCRPCRVPLPPATLPAEPQSQRSAYPAAAPSL